MASNPIRRSITEIDPLFFIPDDVDELVYTEDEEVTSEEVFGEDEFDNSAEDVFLEEEDDGLEYLDVPSIVGIVEQTIRTSATGAQVIDVTLEVEDLNGSAEAEFKVAKI